MLTRKSLKQIKSAQHHFHALCFSAAEQRSAEANKIKILVSVNQCVLGKGIETVCLPLLTPPHLRSPE